MTPALTPKLALDYLRELSADVQDGVVLSSDGALLAGAEDLAGPARDLLSAAADAESVEVAVASGTVFAARSGDHAIALVCGRHALPALARYDLARVLDDLAADRDAA
jgi:hypothetical protein